MDIVDASDDRDRWMATMMSPTSMPAASARLPATGIEATVTTWSDQQVEFANRGNAGKLVIAKRLMCRAWRRRTLAVL